MRPENVIYVAPKERIARLLHKKKEKPPRPSARRIIASICVYLVLSVAWMCIYHFCIVPTYPSKFVIDSSDTEVSLEVTHNRYGQVLGEPFIVSEFTDSVVAGGYVTLKIQGAPNTLYTPALYLKSGKSKNSALVSKYTDDTGCAQWSFRVSHATTPGTYRFTLTAYATADAASDGMGDTADTADICNILSYATMYLTVKAREE